MTGTGEAGQPRSARRTAVAVALWLAAMAGASVATWRYKMEPAAVAEGGAPTAWPEGMPIERAGDRATVVMLAHPRCPCTRASIEELAALVDELGPAARTFVLFAAPPSAPEDWAESDTWRRASALPGVTVVRDVGGVAARRLGAVVSGHTVVFDRGGRLIFSGGVTSARGHAGDSEGRRRIVALLHGQGEVLTVAPTFGCDIEDAPASEVVR